MSDEKGPRQAPDPKTLIEAGIGTHLVNYLMLVGLGSCEKDCPMYDVCVTMKERLKSLGDWPDVKGLYFAWACPLYVYDVESQSSTSSERNQNE